MPLSGASWVRQFPTSTNINDLEPSFRTKVTEFTGALRAAGAKINVSVTYRPPQRAYLMHYCWCIWKRKVNPRSVPAFVPQGSEQPVDIQWLHTLPTGEPDLPKSYAAAYEMVAAYGMINLGVAPALKSNHTVRKAVDMTIRWTGSLDIKDKVGLVKKIASAPRDGTNAELIAVGSTYKVYHFHKVMSDKPHWSYNGR